MTNIETFCYILSLIGKLIIAIYILDFMYTVKSKIKEIKKLLEEKRDDK